MTQEKLTDQKHNKINSMCLTGLFMSLCLVLKLIIGYIPIINGYSVELYLVPYVMGIIFIYKAPHKMFFWLVVPWLLLFINPIAINFYDLLVEYIISLYIFFPFLFFNKIKIKNKKINIALFVIFFLICMVGKLFCHTIAGWLWWTHSFIGSLIFNCPIYIITTLICIPLNIIVYCSLINFI